MNFTDPSIIKRLRVLHNEQDAHSLHFSCSSSSSDKQTLAERILEVPKSYIYIPDKGLCTHAWILLNEYSQPSVWIHIPVVHHFICLSVFRFPIKLAVSAFVAFVAIYHVSFQSAVASSDL